MSTYIYVQNQDMYMSDESGSSYIAIYLELTELSQYKHCYCHSEN